MPTDSQGIPVFGVSKIRKVERRSQTRNNFVLHAERVIFALSEFRIEPNPFLMQTTNLSLQTLGYRQAKTYLVATLFIAGNIILPQLCHLVPQGGLRWLPIYFFTLVGAYRYGWKAGLLVALASPLFNSILFGMPAMASLPSILLKSILLACTAGWAAWRFQRASLWIIASVVLSYQVFGTLGEWAIKGNLYLALQDFRTGIPGMLLQVFGGWLCLSFSTKHHA